MHIKPRQIAPSEWDFYLHILQGFIECPKEILCRAKASKIPHMVAEVTTRCSSLTDTEVRQRIGEKDPTLVKRITLQPKTSLRAPPVTMASSPLCSSKFASHPDFESQGEFMTLSIRPAGFPIPGTTCSCGRLRRSPGPENLYCCARHFDMLQSTTTLATILSQSAPQAAMLQWSRPPSQIIDLLISSALSKSPPPSMAANVIARSPKNHGHQTQSVSIQAEAGSPTRQLLMCPSSCWQLKFIECESCNWTPSPSSRMLQG